MDHISASKTVGRNKRSSLTSSKMTGSESKVIFINPEKLRMTGVNKSSTSHRLVIAQSNSGNIERNESCKRKVFINPNFKQSAGKAVFDKTLSGTLTSNNSHVCVQLKNINDSVNVSTERQICEHKRDIVEAQSCYVNPNFKGILFPQKDNRSKKIPLQNNILKTELKTPQTPRRIVKLDTSISPSSKVHVNKNSNILLLNKLKGIMSVSKPSVNQESNNSKDFFAPLKMKNSSPIQQSRQVKCPVKLSSNLSLGLKNIDLREPKKEISSSDKNQPGPTKIYVNKEKWKTANPAFVKDSKSKPQPIKCQLKTATRNIYVSQSLLTKINGNLKETLLQNSTMPSDIKMVQPCVQKQQNNMSKENQNLTCSQIQAVQIKPEIRKRKRLSSSTCLVSLSSTKMVRKNKSAAQLQPLKTIKRNSDYLDKLKRLEIARAYKNRCYFKRAISKYHAQYIQPSKILKLKRNSFAWSINNLIKMNLHQQKSRMTQSNENMQSKLKYTRVFKNKNEFKKSKILNTTKVSPDNMIKNLQTLKKAISSKPLENACKGSRKLVRTSSSSLLMLSPTKLVRKKLSTTKSILTPVCKMLPTVQIPRLVKSKYKLNYSGDVLKKSDSQLNKMNSRRITQNIKMCYPHSVYTRRKITSQKKSLLSLVNIGGVFYKASYNKLTRKSGVSNKVVNEGPVLQVRGQRFRLDKTGRTLKSLDRNALLGVNKIRRVDIGGVTFIQSKQGTSLVRTNTHTARNRLIQAKQRSISLLTKKLRKNNQPCPLYHRFGRCAGKEKGTCNRIHNPKNIAICKKFVQGKCENVNCLMSHAVGPEKMPTCHHYLAGNCVRDNCPYLHVKVNSKAPICMAFLQGYCADGNNCKKRHKHVCPEFEEKESCARGKYCPYPHPRNKTKLEPKALKQTEVDVKTLTVTEECKEKEVSTFRYFDEEQCRDDVLEESVENVIEGDVEERTQSEICEESTEWLNKRPKLGELPAFIPLSLD